MLTPKQNYSPHEINVRRNDKNILTWTAAISYLNFWTFFLTVYKYDIPMPSKDLLGIFFVMIFSCILVTSNVQQPSYKHVTVCIFLYKYIFWSINNQNRPHTLWIFYSILNPPDFPGPSQWNCKVKMHSNGNIWPIQFPYECEIRTVLFYRHYKSKYTSLYLCNHTETCHIFPQI